MDEETLHLGKPAATPADPDSAVLDCVANPKAGTDYLVRFTCPEFTSVCPVTGQPDFAIGQRLEAGDRPQRRGLAAPRRAQQAGEGAARQRKAQVGDHGAVAITQGEAVDDQPGCVG